MGRDFDHLRNEMSVNAEAERSQDVCDMSSLYGRSGAFRGSSSLIEEEMESRDDVVDRR